MYINVGLRNINLNLIAKDIYLDRSFSSVNKSEFNNAILFSCEGIQ